MHKPLRIKIKDLNEHLLCILCGGYFVNATTIIECLHSFCRSCIVKYVETNKYCPICEVQIHKTKPLLNLRSDQTLQDIVYKLVPGLFQNEMQRRRQFYLANPGLKPQDPEQSGEMLEKSHVYTTDDYISLSLEYYNDDSSESSKQMKRYLRCPAAVSIQHLQKLIRAKYGLLTENKVDIMYQNDILNEDLTLIDVAFKYLWKRKGPLHLTYRIFETHSRKRVKLNHEFDTDHKDNPDGSSNTQSLKVNDVVMTVKDIASNRTSMDVDLNSENDQNTNNNVEINKTSCDFLDKTKRSGSTEEQVFNCEEMKPSSIVNTTENAVSPDKSDKNITSANKTSVFSSGDTGTAVSIANFNNNQISFSFGSSSVQSDGIKTSEIRKDNKAHDDKQNEINEKKSNVGSKKPNNSDAKVLSEIILSSNRINISSPLLNLHTKTLPSFSDPIVTTATIEKEVQLQISESGIISVTTNSPSENNNPISPNSVFTSKSPIPNLISISTSDSVVFSTPQTSRTVPNLISVDAVTKKPDLKSVRKENVKVKGSATVVNASNDNKLCLNVLTCASSGSIYMNTTSTVNSKDSTKIKDNVHVTSISDQKTIISNISLPVYSIAASTTSVSSVSMTQSSPVVAHSNQVLGLKRKSSEIESSTCKVPKTSEQPELFSSVKSTTSVQNSSAKPNVKTQPKFYQVSSNVNIPKTILKPVIASTVKSNTPSQTAQSKSNNNVEGDANTQSALKNMKHVSVTVTKHTQPPAKKSTTVGYKTLRDPPKTWNPTLPMRTFGQMSQNIGTVGQIGKQGQSETTAGTSQTNKILTQPKPAKFFKARNNMPRYLGNPASGVKPMYQISQNPPNTVNTTASSKSDLILTVSTVKLNTSTSVSSVKSTVNTTQTSSSLRTTDSKTLSSSSGTVNTTKPSDTDLKSLQPNISKSNTLQATTITTNSSKTNISNTELKVSCKPLDITVCNRSDIKKNSKVESNISNESITHKNDNTESTTVVSKPEKNTGDVGEKSNSEGHKISQMQQPSLALKSKTTKPISNRSSPMTVSEMLQLRNSNSPKINNITQDSKHENTTSKLVESATTKTSKTENVILDNSKSESSTKNKTASSSEISVMKNKCESNENITNKPDTVKTSKEEKNKEKSSDDKNEDKSLEKVDSNKTNEADLKESTNTIHGTEKRDKNVIEDDRSKSSNFVKIDPKTLKPLTVQAQPVEDVNMSTSKAVNKDRISSELNSRENTPRSELKITQTTVPIYSPIRQKHKHDLKSQKNSSNLNISVGSSNSTKVESKLSPSSQSNPMIDIPNQIKIPIGSMLDRLSPKSLKISSLNISNLIKPELTVSSSQHSPKYDRSSPKTSLPSPKLDRSSPKSPINSLKFDSAKSSILNSPKSQLSPLIDRSSPKSQQTSPKNQQTSPKTQRNAMKSDMSMKSNPTSLSTPKSSSNISKSQKPESGLSMAQKFRFMPSNPFVSNLSSPNLSPNQFLFSNYAMNSAVAAMSYDTRLHHNLSNLAAFHNLPLNLSHLLYNQHRLTYPGAATSNLNAVTNQNVSNLNTALLSGSLVTSSPSLSTSSNPCNSMSSCSSTVSSRSNQISSEIENKTSGVKGELEKSKKS